MEIFIRAMISGVLGAIFSSFLLNAVIRSHEGKPFILGRSRCQVCTYSIPWYDNIPIFSYLILNGKCRKCKNEYGIRYLFSELSSFILFFVIYIFSQSIVNNQVHLVYIYCVSFVLLYLSIYDILYFEIQDKFILPIIVVLTLFSIFTFNIKVFGISGIERIVGGTLMALIFIIIIYFSNGKMGGGEIRMGALLGLIMGSEKFYFAFMIGILFATIYGIANGYYRKLILKEEEVFLKNKVPLVPFLSIGILIELYLQITFNTFTNNI